MADNSFKINKSANFNPQVGAPANPVDGDFFYDSTAQSFAYYHNGSWANMDSVGIVTLTAGPPTPITSAQFTPTIVRNSVVKIVGHTAPVSLYGISSSFSGKKITVYNGGTGIITVEYDDSSEPTSNNRILTPTGGDLNLIVGEVAVFTYDIVASRWLLVSISSQSGAQVIATTTNPGIVTLHQASLFPADGIVLSDGDLNTANGVVGLDANRAVTINAPIATTAALTVTAAANANAAILYSAASGSSSILKLRPTAGFTGAQLQWVDTSGNPLGNIDYLGDTHATNIYATYFEGAPTTGNVVAGSFTGHGSGAGVYGEGGATDAPGGSFTGGGTNGNGIYSLGHGTGSAIFGVGLGTGAAGLFQANSSGPAIESAAGNVRIPAANDYTFTTVKTFHTSVSAADITAPGMDQPTNFPIRNYGIAAIPSISNSGTGSQYMGEARIRVPTGAIITAIQFVADTSATTTVVDNINVMYTTYGGSYYSSASANMKNGTFTINSALTGTYAVSWGTGGTIAVADDSFTIIQFRVAAPGSGKIANIYGIRVTYTMTTIAPSI